MSLVFHRTFHLFWATGFLVCLRCCPLSAQTLKDGDNIVPNPGFERFVSPPVGWSYKGAYFAQVVKYWFSATTASPDVYGPGVKVPQDWADKGFGEQAAHQGRCMAGLTLYGCTNGKPHCREYVEIQLAEPLVPGQTYHVEFWVTHLKRSLQINKLGAYFSEKRIQRQSDELLALAPQFVAGKLVVAPGGRWVKLSGQFQAANEAEYLTLGNFSEDSATQTSAYRADCFNYAYYYIDDVLVKKVPPFAAVPIKSDDLTRQPLEEGKAIQLKDIYFEFDKHELMPRSYVELNKLLRILRENPGVHIQIVGHTDNIGKPDYNKYLSRKRAKSVALFLMENGISARRLRYHGEGESRPVATNDSEEGRFKNRRVEFVILKR
ncbi:MAG: OmpA family protein [Saprospirales bacterium]|nr:OmpA family protein [Saprospirales bacterium]MBK8924220.1 OmpA family protein [Saprospirales bacterium]